MIFLNYEITDTFFHKHERNSVLRYWYSNCFILKWFNFTGSKT